METVFSCKRCGRAIFRSSQVVRRANLWDLGEYQAECFVLADADLEGLRRYDCSLHEGWYCCRFIAMRMVVDKFGTGRDLLVYADAVIEHEAGVAPTVERSVSAQTRLGTRDFDAVVGALPRDELAVVKLGAIWCPPCRMMDAVVARIEDDGGIPGVRFFEVDIDEEPALADRFAVRSVPTFVFFRDGKMLDARFSGAIARKELVRACTMLRARPSTSRESNTHG